jgi:D-arabinose 1-dehydrogenase-like Zn-dependent alcohol dehydrogenase
MSNGRCGLLPLAASVPIQPAVEIYRVDEANRALIALKRGRIRGATMLLITS